MTRRTRLNTALALAAFALAVLLWLLRTAPTTAPRPLLAVAAPAISNITIQPADSPPIVLQRRQGQWYLRQPVATRANAPRVKALLAMATIAPQRRYERGAIAAEQTGLDKPVATIQFNDAPALAIGKPVPATPGTNKHYVRVGDTVATAAIAHAGLLNIDWAQWVEPQILAAADQLQTLQLPQLTLQRTATGGWHVSPAERDQGADAAQAMVTAWHHATALTIKPAATGPAQAHIQLLFADGHQRQLDVMARQPQLVLRDNELGIAYHLAGDLGKRLLALTAAGDSRADAARKPRRRPSRSRHNSGQRSRQDN